MALPSTIKEKTWFVIAGYNEEKRIGVVVDKLQKRGFSNIVVVDDGSADATQVEAKKAGATVLRHTINLGQGAALRTGTRYVLEKTSGKYLVHFDADDQHRPEDAEKMIALLSKGSLDVVTGSRFLSKQGKANLPFTKRLFLRVGVLVNYILYGIVATDAHNGLRAFTVDAASRVEFKENGMEHATEIAELIHKTKLRHKEIPVVIEYHEYGQNIFDAVKIGIRLVMRRLLQ